MMFTAKNIKNFITAEQAKLLSDIFQLFHPTEIDQGEDGNCYELYRNRFYDLFLDVCKPEIVDIVNEPLVPSYSFARKYLKNSLLGKHTDRESCVYTCTLTLDGSDNVSWPIFYECDEKENAVFNHPGDMLILKGCDIPHWRKKLDSDSKIQLFMHYVPNKPQFKPFFYDGHGSLALDASQAGYDDDSDLTFKERKDIFFEGAREAVIALKSKKEESYENRNL